MSTIDPLPLPADDGSWPPAITPVVLEETDEAPLAAFSPPPAVITPEQQAIFDRLLKEAGHVPSQTSWVKACRAEGIPIANTGPAGRSAVYQALLQAVPRPPSDAVLAAEAAVQTERQRLLTCQHDLQDATREVERLDQALTAWETARLTSNEATIEQREALEQAHHVATRRATKYLPQALAERQAALATAEQALHQARQVELLDRWNATDAELRAYYADYASRIEPLLEYHETGYALLAKRRALAAQLGLAFPGSPEDSLDGHLDGALAPVARAPVPGGRGRPVLRLAVPDLVQADRTLRVLTLADLASQDPTSRRLVYYCNTSPTALHEVCSAQLCNITRGSVAADNVLNQTLNSGLAVALTGEEEERLRARYGAAVWTPDVWATYQGKPSVGLFNACGLWLPGAACTRFYNGEARGFTTADFAKVAQ